MKDDILHPYEDSTDGQSVINLLSSPAFKGDSDKGINWLCPHCHAIIAEAIHPGQILNLVFRCYSCSGFSASPIRAPGQPLPGRPIVLACGDFYFKTTVNVAGKPFPAIGYQARDGYLHETAAPPIPFAARMGNSTELSPELLKELATRAIDLLGVNYSHLEASAKKSAASRTPKRNQPRLMGLIAYAEEASSLLAQQRSSQTVSLDGDRISELDGTIAIFDRWRNHPAWPQLVNSLATETEGPHSLMLLTAASYLNESGNGVGIVFKEATGRKADLWIEPDLLQKVNIEIKTPQAFRNVWPQSFSTIEAEAVITRQIDKAASTRRGQLGSSSSGILAIGAFHLPLGGLDNLVSITRQILDKQAEGRRKPNLAGVLLSNFGYTLRAINGNPSSMGLASTLTSKFVPYPGHQGSAKIEQGLPRWQQSFTENSSDSVDGT